MQTPHRKIEPVTFLLSVDSANHCTVEHFENKAQKAFVCDRLECEQQKVHPIIIAKFFSSFPNIFKGSSPDGHLGQTEKIQEIFLLV